MFAIRRLVVFTMIATLLPIVGATTASADNYRWRSTEATYQVTLTNITQGQYLTPPNWAAHDRDVRVFSRGGTASPGVQAVAENGGVPVLAAELTANVDDAGRGISGIGAAAPIAPGESATFEITTDERRLSLVSMIICTNDGFAGVDSAWLPFADGQTWRYRVRGHDAGTEINTEMRSDLVPAAFCGPGEGTTESNPALAENGKIRRHRTLQNTGDLMSSLDWRGAVATLTIRRVPAPASYTVEVTNLTNGQCLTPPNFAAHSRAVDVFQRGKPASAGVQAVAENGGVDTLAAELRGAVDDPGLGVSGVGGDGPIAPGDTRTFEFTTTADRLSLVSMVICTNDGFAGLDSRWLPLWSGSSWSYYGNAYDAGTEINTEMRADLVGAPFCGEGEGTGESNPALAENGVIRRHRTLQRIGDLDPSLDWKGPVMQVRITRN